MLLSVHVRRTGRAHFVFRSVSFFISARVRDCYCCCNQSVNRSANVFYSTCRRDVLFDLQKLDDANLVYTIVFEKLPSFEQTP